MKNMKQKKSGIFVSLLPTINKLIDESYTHESIIEKLKADHNVDFNIGTFRSYLSRFQNVKTDKKVNLDNVVTKDNQESYQPSESTDSKSID